MVSRMKKEKPKQTRESTDQYLLRHWKEICREVDERKKKRRQKEFMKVAYKINIGSTRSLLRWKHNRENYTPHTT